MLRRLPRELLHSGNLIGTALIFIVLGMGSQNGVEGQVTEASKRQLLNRIQAEAANLDLSRLPDWETSRAEVLARIDAVERYLQRAATSENRSAWLRYLDLDRSASAFHQLSN